jgi:hypothetical protein
VKHEPPGGGAQCPPEQLPEQHWVPDVHADALVVPLARHSPDGQVPPLHLSPEQHGTPSTHALPPGTQKVSVWHWPGLPASRLQLLEQQSSSPVHESPFSPHVPGGGGGGT